jgi:hypothetical protein
MTDLETLELILRRVLDRVRVQFHETSAQELLSIIVDELTRENNAILERKRLAAHQ